MTKAGRVIGALTLATAMLSPAAIAECRIQQIAEIKVRIENSRPLIEGEINGKSVLMLADTGAQSSTIVRSKSNELGLKPLAVPGMRFQGVGGGSAASFVTVDKVSFGGMASGGFKMFVTGEGEVDADPNAPAAVIGADFLGQADVEFDLPNKIIRLLRISGCSEGQAVYWNKPYAVTPLAGVLKGAQFEVDVAINGKTVRALLDSGAVRSVLTVEGAATAGIEAQSAAGPQFHGLGGLTGQANLAQLDSFAIDTEVVRNAQLPVADLFGANKKVTLGSWAPRYQMDFPEMLLGGDFFLSHRILVARSEKRVYLTYSGGPIFVR